LHITVNITLFDGSLKEAAGFHDNSVCHLRSVYIQATSLFILAGVVYNIPIFTHETGSTVGIEVSVPNPVLHHHQLELD